MYVNIRNHQCLHMMKLNKAINLKHLHPHVANAKDKGFPLRDALSQTCCWDKKKKK